MTSPLTNMMTCDMWTVQAEKCIHMCYFSLLDTKQVKDIFPGVSVQFNRSVLSNSLQPHGLQHARPPCPSPSPEVHSNSGPSSR